MVRRTKSKGGCQKRERERERERRQIERKSSYETKAPFPPSLAPSLPTRDPEKKKEKKKARRKFKVKRKELSFYAQSELEVQKRKNNPVYTQHFLKTRKLTFSVFLCRKPCITGRQTLHPLTYKNGFFSFQDYLFPHPLVWWFMTFHPSLPLAHPPPPTTTTTILP